MTGEAVAISHRAQIIEATLERLALIRRVNGYLTDAGEVVIVGEVTLGPDDAAVAICLVPGKTEPLGSSVNEHVSCGLPLQIAAVARVDSWRHSAEAWLRAEAVIADIVRAMEAEDRTLGGLVHGDLRRGDVEPLERGEGGLDVGALITYTAPYRTRWGHI